MISHTKSVCYNVTGPILYSELDPYYLKKNKKIEKRLSCYESS